MKIQQVCACKLFHVPVTHGSSEQSKPALSSADIFKKHWKSSLLEKDVISCPFHVLSLISLRVPFPIVPRCWLHLDQKFIWAFLGPVCAIICVSEYVAPAFLT